MVLVHTSLRTNCSEINMVPKQNFFPWIFHYSFIPSPMSESLPSQTTHTVWAEREWDRGGSGGSSLNISGNEPGDPHQNKLGWPVPWLVAERAGFCIAKCMVQILRKHPHMHAPSPGWMEKRREGTAVCSHAPGVLIPLSLCFCYSLITPLVC